MTSLKLKSDIVIHLLKITASLHLLVKCFYLFSFAPSPWTDSSVGKEFACNAGDPGSIPGSGRSAREGIGYPLQYSWASLVVQLVKNPPAMRETWIWSLGWKDSPGGGKGYPLQYSGLENSMDCIIHGITKSWTRLSNFHFHFIPSGSES